LKKSFSQEICFPEHQLEWPMNNSNSSLNKKLFILLLVAQRGSISPEKVSITAHRRVFQMLEQIAAGARRRRLSSAICGHDFGNVTHCRFFIALWLRILDALAKVAAVHAETAVLRPGSRSRLVFSPLRLCR